MEVLKREAIREEDRWAIQDLYINESAWKNDGVKLDLLIEELKSYEGMLHKSATYLLDALCCYSSVNCLFEDCCLSKYCSHCAFHCVF